MEGFGFGSLGLVLRIWVLSSAIQRRQHSCCDGQDPASIVPRVLVKVLEGVFCMVLDVAGGVIRDRKGSAGFLGERATRPAASQHDSPRTMITSMLPVHRKRNDYKEPASND